MTSSSILKNKKCSKCINEQTFGRCYEGSNDRVLKWGLDPVIQPLSLVCQIKSKIPRAFHQHLLCRASEGRTRYGYKTHINAKNSSTTHKSSQMSAYGEIRPLIVFCHPATFQEFTPGNRDLGTDGDFVWQPCHRGKCFSGQGRLPLMGKPPVDCVWVCGGRLRWPKTQHNVAQTGTSKNGNCHRASKQA